MVGIVVLEYNNSKDTINCVKSIIKYENINHIKLVIVSNGSTTNIRDEIKKELSFLSISILTDKQLTELENDIGLPFLSYLFLNDNKGYAVGNNVGVEYLSHDSSIDSVMILNNDTLFVNDIIKPLHSLLLSIEDACIVTPLLLERDGKTVNKFTAKKKYDFDYFFWRYMLGGAKFFGKDKGEDYYIDVMNINQDIIEIGVPWGACFMIKMSDWQKIGGFDPNTFLYFEEDILAKKIEKIHGKAYLIKTCSCIHLEAQSTSILKSKSPLECYYHSLIYYFSTYDKINRIKLTILKVLFRIYLFRIRHRLFK